MFRGFTECILWKMLKQPEKILTNQKVLLKDPVWSNEGPRLVMDLFGLALLPLLLLDMFSSLNWLQKVIFLNTPIEKKMVFRSI